MPQSHRLKSFLKPIEDKEEHKIMKLDQLIGWMIGAMDLILMAYSIVDFTPFALMVGISLTYIAIIIIKNWKLNTRPKR